MPKYLHIYKLAVSQICRAIRNEIGDLAGQPLAASELQQKSQSTAETILVRVISCIWQTNTKEGH